MDLAQYNAVVGSTADEFATTGLDIAQLFGWQILKQNRMYDLPVNSVPSLDDLGESPVARVQGFLKTLKKEMDEGFEILAVVCYREWLMQGATITAQAIQDLVNRVMVEADDKRKATIVEFLTKSTDLVEFDRQTLVMLADWLADLNVYIRSESLKYGIPHEAILACVMGSNFTKLGLDGLPIKDANGKFLKGPNFQPPEAHIYATMFESDSLYEEAQEKQLAMNRLNTLALPILIDPMAQILATEKDFQEEEEADPEYDPDGQDSTEDEGSEVEGSAPLFDE